MHFDDRLGTVLRQRTGGEAVARIQYRQLLDLLGTMPSEAQGPQMDAAYARLAELSAAIPAFARAAMLREPGLRLRSPRLVAVLAEGEPQVGAAAIQRAELEAEQWLDLAPALPAHARGVMRSRRDLGPEVDRLLARLGIRDRGLPPAETAEAREPAVAPPGEKPPHPAPTRREGIGALVERIENFRKARQVIEGEAAYNDSPRLPLAETGGIELARSRPRAFDFLTDSEGRISWADATLGPMAVGLRLAPRDPGSPVAPSPGLVTAFHRRLPIRAAAIEIAGAPAICGTWQVDATPVFDPAGGRFTGYAGRMRRPPAPGELSQPPGPDTREGDRVRQLLHELRTPVNAIQGFAEVIQQQLFGPTPHEYRALAAAIAGDAARMLAGFEELERLAKLETGALELEEGDCDFAAVTRQTVNQLEPFTEPRGSGFVVNFEDKTLPVAVSHAEAARLAWRLLATLAGASAPGEMLKLRADRRDGMARLALELPAGLAALEGEELFHATTPAGSQALSAGMFGTGFSLRLARAEAREAGGSLERRGQKLRLTLPLLTANLARHSQGG